MKDKIFVIKWICPYCNSIWWEQENNFGSIGDCPYCKKSFEKEYIEK